MFDDDLVYTYDKNIERVKNLLDSYGNFSPSKKGRKSAEASDILRVTVVLLHATLEDFLRSLLKQKLPNSGGNNLKKIPLAIAVLLNDLWAESP